MAKKILIIDDSALMRRVISDIINEGNEYEVAAIAKDGLEGFDLICSNPTTYSAIILDINMPKMNGLELLKKLQQNHIDQTVIVVSTVAKEGAKETITALEYGAFDFVTKPENYLDTKSEDFKIRIHQMLDVATNTKASLERTSLSNSTTTVSPRTTTDRSSSLGTRQIGGLGANRVSRNLSDANNSRSAIGGSSLERRELNRTTSGATSRETSANSGSVNSNVGADRKPSPLEALAALRQRNISHDVVAQKVSADKYTGVKRGSKKLIALACSTGGPKSLQQVIPMLPKNIDAGMVMVQHMPAGFTASLAQRLNEISEVQVKEAQDGDVIKKGVVYIAPGGRHMEILRQGAEHVIKLNDSPAIEGLRPCANIMYNSLKDADYDEITCVVLTGMGADGTNGIKGLYDSHKRLHIISQDEDSCVVYGMPKAIAQTGLVDEVVPLNQVAEVITKNVGVS